MRLQFLILGIATAISLFVGAGKWRARLTAASDFVDAERTGRWTFVLPDTTGVMTWSKYDGRESIEHYRTLYAADGGIGATRDLSRVAYVDNTKWDAPAVAVRAASISEKPIALVTHPQGHQLACPKFDADGSLLYLETTAWQPSTSYSASSRPPTALKRLELPRDDRILASPTAETVRLPAAIGPDDCFELSADGTRIAWTGTDFAIHVATRTGDDFLADHKTEAGSNVELSPDGTWLAVVDGGKLLRVDLANGSRSTIAQTATGFRAGAISPDGTWVLVQESGSFAGHTWVAYRVKDGAPVALGVPDRATYYMPDRDKLWIAREGELADPTPVPTRTPKARTTPRRRTP